LTQQRRLQAVEQTLAPNDPLRKNIDDYITQLNGIKSDINTKVTIEDQQALAQLQAIQSYVQSINGDLATASALLNGFPGRMVGGPVNESGIYTVGEAGPETVFLPRGANVRTAGDTMTALAGGGGGGGSTFNITINVSPLSNPADIGGAVVNAIKAYERRSGSSWRRAA
jgi:hypothetical protein